MQVSGGGKCKHKVWWRGGGVGGGSSCRAKGFLINAFLKILGEKNFLRTQRYTYGTVSRWSLKSTQAALLNRHLWFEVSVTVLWGPVKLYGCNGDFTGQN